MFRWTWNRLRQSLGIGIGCCLVIAVVCGYRVQNHTIFADHGHFPLTTNELPTNRYEVRIAGDDDRTKEPPSPSTREPTNVVARKFVLSRRAGLSVLGRGFSVAFTAEIPQFPDDSEFLVQLNQMLRREYESAATEFAPFDWPLIVEGFRDPQPYLQNWDCTIEIDLMHVSPRAVSMLESRAEYTGGAHGNLSVIGRCFIGTQDGIRQLTLGELFDPSSPWVRCLVDFCQSDLRCQGASSISDVSVEDPESARLSTDDLASFTLSPEGLTFYFSPYHVGCYAEGVYIVRVPTSVFRDCLPPQSPARRFMTADCR